MALRGDGLKRHITACFAASLILLAFWAGSAQASQIVLINMDQMMNAPVIFTGKCVGAEAKALETGGRTLPVTTYTFEVTDSIKGDVPATFSFTHLGASRADSARLGLGYVPGMPHFEVGKEYTVFLTSETKLGLRGVMNLGAGKFNMVKGSDGKAQVVNDYGNKGLFRGAEKSSSMTKAMSAGGVKPGAAGPVDYDGFVRMVRDLDGRKK
jgi:hypothetical protein